MKKLASGSDIEKGWAVIDFLKEATSKWPPPVRFVLILPERGKVEVWALCTLKKDELELLKKWLRERKIT